MQKREFKQLSRTGKTRVWTIEVVGDEIRSAYGEEGGKMQTVVDVGVRKNIGKVNEISAEDDAMYLAGRAILEKTRNGYREEGTERATRLDWNTDPPESFRLFKPDNTLSTTLEKKAEQNKAWFSRKRDGEMLVVLKGPDGKVSIVSRRMLPSHHLENGAYVWKDRFPHLVAEIENNDDIPPCTMLLGDVVGTPDDDQRWKVATFMKSLTPEAQQMVPPFYYCWDIAFWGGVDLVSTTTVGERYRIIWEVFGKGWRDHSFVVPVEVWRLFEIVEAASVIDVQNRSKSGVECAKIVSKQKGWEGWVVVDPEGEYGDKAYNFRGKTDRPGKFCGKLKASAIDDFVGLYDPNDTLGNGKFGAYGNGNNRGQVGSIDLFQYDSAGELVYICAVGGGITDDFRAKWSDPRSYPLCIEVEYTERTYKSEGAKTNALQYPRVLSVREDKLIEECVNTQLDLE